MPAACRDGAAAAGAVPAAGGGPGGGRPGAASLQINLNYFCKPEYPLPLLLTEPARYMPHLQLMISMIRTTLMIRRFAI